MPKFIPGKHKGKAVVVPYSLPIVFNGHSKETPEYDKFKADLKKKTNINKVRFNEVDVPPVLKSCVSISDVEEQKKCTSYGVSKFVNKNFNMQVAKDAGLTGEKHLIEVLFKINKQGNAENIKARGPHPDLEKEAMRVINLLPEFIPGKHKGEKVDVEYTLPIEFFIAE